MKKFLILSLLFLAFYSVESQPVINNQDMPVTPDTIRYRTNSVVSGLNYQQTGMNYTWDFSSLIGMNAGADTFLSINSAPLIYLAYFSFGSNNANMASPQGDFNFIPGFELSDLYNFHKNQSSSFTMAGMGASISGIPVPIKYNTADIIYKFPLTVGTEDSSQVSFSMGITGLGYLDIQKKRHNYVDGWGTLILPTGTFQAIRVKSVITETDSLYVDTLGMGMAIPRNSIEYKWLTDGCGIPQLQVTEQYGVLTTWKWIDETAMPVNFSVTIGNDTAICQGQSLVLTANVTNGTSPFTYIWNDFTFNQSITVSPNSTTTYSVTVADAEFHIAYASITVTVLPNPVPVITAPFDTVCTVYSSPANQAYLSTAPGYSYYYWSTGQAGTSLNSITAQSVVPADSTFSVIVADNYGCEGMASYVIYFVVCSGIDEPGQPRSISLYPNPASGNLTISIPSIYKEISAITLSDETGKLLRTFDCAGLQNNGSGTVLTINDLDLPPGFYVLSIKHNEGIITQKLMINK